ncbi:hypothetical protein BBJ28_00007944 [Nothophytophthora sp. Chile5]|nr:hypothetical protein BBJ28_00007944 [Nothophytophthora sp. Chile5]
MEMAGAAGDEARVDADAAPSPTRYAFLELKEAQRICGLKMTAAALRECGTASAAQKEIFRAHVSDLCATIFSAALRKYNPEDKVANTDLSIVYAVWSSAPESASDIGAELTLEQLEAMKDTYTKVCAESQPAADRREALELLAADVNGLCYLVLQAASTIASTSVKLSQVMSQTTETIHIVRRRPTPFRLFACYQMLTLLVPSSSFPLLQVEQAMKRPKTAIDIAMEESPLKPRVLLNEQVCFHCGLVLL